ncbi:hypothetical protein ABIF21_000143 [Bradyrhizobium elkanii]|uniref:hypothetical protein n=1 Tax=Bradyrhizobium elkanii TaxID=29448 RepID=UPI001022511A|nr:hypothetical protein [Bradyrhizobium elkanii]NWL43822.1 hypothetical protein [Bradyrhizobium elkanii]RYM19357.1 hypothetical protein EWH13_28775 [Bradyrhizobium elkanii]
MAQATNQFSTKPLSSLFRDPVLRAAFKAAEDEGLSPSPVVVDLPRTLDGGAAARPELEMV